MTTSGFTEEKQNLTAGTQQSMENLVLFILFDHILQKYIVVAKIASFDNFVNLYVHVFKEPLLSPTAYVNGPDIEISIDPPP